MRINQKLLELVQKESRKSSLKYRHVCVVLKGNEVLFCCFNKHIKNSRPIVQNSLHAEIIAISRIEPKLLTKANFIVARVGGGQKLGYSKPCEKCIRRMQRFGIRNVFFSTGIANEFERLEI